MSDLTFHLTSRPFCPVAQRVLIALGARGLGADHRAVPEGRHGRDATNVNLPQLSVTLPGGAKLTLTDGMPMLELLEELSPNEPLHPYDIGQRATHRAMMELGAAIQARLSIVTRARTAPDLDLAVFNLREFLARAEHWLAEERVSTGRRLSNVDVVFAPTLWRLQMLDARAQAHLLSGFVRLKGWALWLSGQPSVNAVLPSAAVARYLADLQGRHALIVDQSEGRVWQELANTNTRLRDAG